MYAIIKTGGKQYRVAEGDVITIERLPAEVEEEVTFDQVLAVGSGGDIRVGAPVVDGAAVRGTVLDHGRAKKITVLRYRPKKRIRRRRGHRQHFTRVRIDGIDTP